MKLQDKGMGQITDELNELKLKIAKINARRNAQINIVKRDLDRRSNTRNGTLLKSRYLYPNYYYGSPSYRYPLLCPRYHSLENLSSDQYYQKPYKKAVAFTEDCDEGTNLKSNPTSASMSDLLSKLKDFVFEQEKQLTNDLLNKIAESRRAWSFPRSTTSLSSKDLTSSDLFLNPVNKKDNFYKRYNAYAKRILKPISTLSTRKDTYKPPWTNHSWLQDDYNYSYDEPPWARWYRRYLTSPRYRHNLSDYNYYVPKLFTLPPDIESIVGDKTKSTNRTTYDTRSISPANKLYSFKYDPFESDSYLKPRLPNWKQYYYTQKLKSKSSKDNYLQDYDPHYDFFPDAASVDSVGELSNNPEQLLDEYRDAIYEDVIQNLRTKQQRQQSNTFPRRKPRSVRRSLFPTFSTKYYSEECDIDKPTNMSYDFDSSAIKSSYPANMANESKLSFNTYESKKYDRPEWRKDRMDNVVTEFSGSKPVPPSTITVDNHKPLIRQSAVPCGGNADTKNLYNNQSSEGELIPAKTIGIEFTSRLACKTGNDKDVYRPVLYQPQTSYLNTFGTDRQPQNYPLDMFQEKKQIPDVKTIEHGTTVSDEVRRPSRQPLFTGYRDRFESDLKSPNVVEQSTSASYRNKIKEEPTPVGMSTSTPGIVGPNSVIMVSDACRLSQPQSFIESDTNKSFNPIDQNSRHHRLDTEEIFKKIPQENTKSYNTYSDPLLPVLEKPPSSSDKILFQRELDETAPNKNTPSTLMHHNSSQHLLNRRDSVRMAKNLSNQLSTEQITNWADTETPSLNPHLTTKITNYTNYSTSDQSYPQVVSPQRSSRPSPLRRRSSQISGPPAAFSSADLPRRGSTQIKLEQVGNSSDFSQKAAPSFRRQSSKLSPTPLPERADYDPSRHSSTIITQSYPYETERNKVGAFNAERQPSVTDQFANYPPENAYQGSDQFANHPPDNAYPGPYCGIETIRDPGESYKSTDLSEPIYEQREEGHIDYYYDNNYQPTHSGADQRYEGDGGVPPIVQAGSAMDYDESNAVYEPYEPSYQQDKYYGNEENFPITAYYDSNTGGAAHHPEGQNNERYQNVKYSVQGVRQNYNEYDAYEPKTADNGYYVQDTFPVEYDEYTADENKNIPATDSVESTISEPPEALENKEQPEDHQLCESKGARKPLETTQPEELNKGNNKINSTDRKKSVDNELKTREPISRRTSKISLQSSVDDKKSRAQLIASGSEPLKRTSRVKQAENKLKRSSSTISKTKTPISKRT